MDNLRKTKSVKAVLKIFEDTNHALSVVELVEKLDGEMNKTTVYRILQRFENNGILHSFIGKDGLMWYAKCKGCTSSGHSDVHPHFQCQNCGKIECLAVSIPLPAVPNYKLDSVKLLLIGQCDNCLS